ncbi:MAG: MerR family DNA-binding protein [Stenomitos frigidus ULC029]
MIKWAQSLGLASGKIKAILAIPAVGKLTCNDAKGTQHLQAKVTIVNRSIQALQSLQAELNDILAG